MKFVFILSMLCCLCFCSRQKPVKPKESIQQDKITIIVQPFADIADTDIQYVYTQLQQVYPLVHLNPKIDIPKQAFYKECNRYRADSIINFINRNTAPQHVTICLTSKDISTTKDGITDWGIMGLGFCPGKACIASTFRLSKLQQQMQLFKVAIHELGHTQGLPHCDVKSCFMRDAEGRNPTNDEKEFCSKCKAVLVAKGFRF